MRTVGQRYVFEYYTKPPDYIFFLEGGDAVEKIVFNRLPDIASIFRHLLENVGSYRRVMADAGGCQRMPKLWTLYDQYGRIVWNLDLGLPQCFEFCFWSRKPLVIFMLVWRIYRSFQFSYKRNPVGGMERNNP